MTGSATAVWTVTILVTLAGALGYAIFKEYHKAGEAPFAAGDRVRVLDTYPIKRMRGRCGEVLEALSPTTGSTVPLYWVRLDGEELGVSAYADELERGAQS